jgi:hypothetical protein
LTVNFVGNDGGVMSLTAAIARATANIDAFIKKASQTVTLTVNFAGIASPKRQLEATIKSVSDKFDDLSGKIEEKKEMTVDCSSATDSINKTTKSLGIMHEAVKGIKGASQDAFSAATSAASSCGKTIEGVGKTIEKTAKKFLMFAEATKEQNQSVVNYLNRTRGGTHVTSSYVGAYIDANGIYWGSEGGSIPGEGEGDTVPAMLTPGEFVINKRAVSMLGEGFFSMLNGIKNMSLPKINMAPLMQSFATGGAVRSQSMDVMTLNLDFGIKSIPLQVIGKPSVLREQIKTMQKEMKKMRLAHG